MSDFICNLRDIMFHRTLVPMVHHHTLVRMVHHVEEETAVIEDTYDYQEEETEMIGVAYGYGYPEMIEVSYNYEEETVMIGAPYDYQTNHRSYSYDQPTYEENLELEEQMGRVDSRLSEETIMGNLKITRYDATSHERMNEEPEICVICQGEYEKNELIGGLHCRHEYHVECVKKWLQHHNSCPICKADAVLLST